MRLHSITLRNYRCYRHLEIAFQPGFNVLAGVNGSGKTSILKGIRDALAGFLASSVGTGPEFSPLADADAARIQPKVSGNRHRFEAQYPVGVSAVAEVLGQTYQWSEVKASQTNFVSFDGDTLGQVWQSALTANHPSSADRPETTLPIVAFYPAYRQWQAVRVSETTAATERPSRMDGYGSWWDAASDSAAMQQWAIAKSMERLQFASEKGAGWNAIDDDELAMVNGALAAAVEEAKGLRYDFSQKNLLVEWADGTATPFQNLSDGQRVAIALVVDIARRMCLLNPHLAQRVTKETPGVVLIDELDIHLHPRWQRRITKSLSAAFPLVQFIAATHSPQVLGELRPEQIILLHQQSVDHPQVSYGLDASRVLEQIMGADQRAADVEQKLSALFASIERNELASARELLAELRKTAPGIPELTGAEALLKRKEVIGR